MKKIVLEDQIRVHYQCVEATEILSKEIEQYIRAGLKSGKTDVVFVCIGTDRSTGDSLGPLVGYRVFGYENYGFYVYGNLDEPVHAQNLETVLSEIQETYDNPYIVAVDACLGKLESVGYICVGKGSIDPGAALNKKLVSVGDMYITGIVNLGGFLDFMVLQGTRLSVVFSMSNKISHSIRRAIISICKDNKTVAERIRKLA